MKQRIKGQYITAATFLIISSVIVKIISAFYKIPLTAYIGAQGRGYFSVAYNLCLPFHALTMGAFPVALTKLISTAEAKGDSYKTFALRAASKRTFFIIGALGSIIMFIAAKPYSNIIAASPNSLMTVLTLSPSIFFSCLCACNRSYAEGFLDMKLTSFSQLAEALVKMIFGLLFAKLSLAYFYSFYTKTGFVLGFLVHSESEALARIYPLTSACAMLGAGFGSFIAYIYSAIYIKRKYKVQKVTGIMRKEAMNELWLFSVSLVGATVIQSLANFADTSSLQHCLSMCDENVLRSIYNYSGDEIYTYVLGIYATALDFKNLVPAIVMSLGIAAVPAVSSAYENSSKGFSALLCEIFKYSTIMSLFGSLAISLFNTEILQILFGQTNPDITENSDKLLFHLGLSAAPSALATTVVYCAQSLGLAKKGIPSFIASGVLRVVLNIVFISDSRLNVIGSAISGFCGYLLITIWNIVLIKKNINAKIKVTKTFIMPIICAFLTFFAVKYLKSLNFFSENFYLNFAFYTTIYLIVFATLLIFTKCITFKEIFEKKQKVKFA